MVPPRSTRSWWASIARLPTRAWPRLRPPCWPARGWWPRTATRSTPAARAWRRAPAPSWPPSRRPPRPRRSPWASPSRTCIAPCWTPPAPTPGQPWSWATACRPTSPPRCPWACTVCWCSRESAPRPRPTRACSPTWSCRPWPISSPPSHACALSSWGRTTIRRPAGSSPALLRRRRDGHAQPWRCERGQAQAGRQGDGGPQVVDARLPVVHVEDGHGGAGTVQKGQQPLVHDRDGRMVEGDGRAVALTHHEHLGRAHGAAGNRTDLDRDRDLRAIEGDAGRCLDPGQDGVASRPSGHPDRCGGQPCPGELRAADDLHELGEVGDVGDGVPRRNRTADTRLHRHRLLVRLVAYGHRHRHFGWEQLYTTAAHTPTGAVKQLRHDDERRILCELCIVEGQTRGHNPVDQMSWANDGQCGRRAGETRLKVPRRRRTEAGCLHGNARPSCGLLKLHAHGPW